MSDSPRLYIACLAAYNSGRLHGEWIDATQSAEEMQAEIAKILRNSPCPNVVRCDFRCTECGVTFTRDVADLDDNTPRACPECDRVSDVMTDGSPYPSAEEYAIHDSEGFGKIKIGEIENLETLAEIAAAIAEHGAPFLAWAEYQCGDHRRALDTFQEAYRGTYKSAADYAEEFTEQTGEGIPAHLAPYIDYEAMARDWDMGGDITTIEDGGEVHIFDGTV